jgi:RNA polymerase sigma-70 factor, ECF subfamily
LKPNPPPPRPVSSDRAPTAELLGRIRHGDAQARDRLLERYLPRLKAWAHGRIPAAARDLSDTDDLVQASLIQTLKHLEDFHPRHEGAFMAYVRQILVNKIRDEARRSNPQKRRDEMPEGLVNPAASPLEEAVGAELLDAYDRGLGKLTEGQREAVILRVEFGYTYPEIAEAIEAPSTDAARMLVVRGLERLTEELDART